tara:strand:- start:80 stop:184 length:105 start_codon:yes stop_codon:yes gene_type:complete
MGLLPDGVGRITIYQLFQCVHTRAAAKTIFSVVD